MRKRFWTSTTIPMPVRYVWKRMKTRVSIVVQHKICWNFGIGISAVCAKKRLRNYRFVLWIKVQELLISNFCTFIFWFAKRLTFRFKISKRIGTLSVLPYFKVQVVSSRIAGGTDIADHFALFHFLTYGHADRGAVGIQGVKSIIVVYLDMISISAAALAWWGVFRTAIPPLC